MSGRAKVQPSHHAVVTEPTRVSGTIVVLRPVLAKGKCLSSAQLGALSKSAHLPFARVGVLLGVHLDVALRKAAAAVMGEEIAVTTVRT